MPFTPGSQRINTMSNRQVNGNEENYQVEDMVLI